MDQGSSFTILDSILTSLLGEDKSPLKNPGYLLRIWFLKLIWSSASNPSTSIGTPWYSPYQFHSSIPAFEELFSFVRLKLPKHAALSITAENLNHLELMLWLGKGELFSHINSFLTGLSLYCFPSPLLLTGAECAQGGQHVQPREDLFHQAGLCQGT